MSYRGFSLSHQTHVSAIYVTGGIKHRPVLRVVVYLGEIQGEEQHLAWQHFLFALKRLQELFDQPGVDSLHAGISSSKSTTTGSG